MFGGRREVQVLAEGEGWVCEVGGVRVGCVRGVWVRVKNKMKY